ncbi:MAG: hypothetical protein HY394_01760 [Candidatus Diapherotrites archaeon]|nr:hypothetical protein [Candidatus Diapherotrites archaeon]
MQINKKEIPATIAVLLLLLLGLEITARVFLAPYEQPLCIFQADGKLGFRFQPNAQATLEKQEYRASIKTNSLGFRGPEPSAEKTKTRILVLGDSWVVGQGVAEEKTFTRKLENYLAAEGGSVETINAGTSAYGTRQERIMLEGLMPEIKPDVVLLAFYNGNDFSENNDDFLKTTVVNGCIGRGSLFDKAKAFVFKNSRLAYFVEKRLELIEPFKTVFRATGISDSALPDSMAMMKKNKGMEFSGRTGKRELTETELQKMKKAAESAGAKFAIAVIPARMEVDGTELEKAAGYFGVPAQELDENRIPEYWKSFSEQTGIPILYLGRDAGAQSAMYFAGDGHWNEKGHAFAAEKIAQFLQASFTVK